MSYGIPQDERQERFKALMPFQVLLFPYAPPPSSALPPQLFSLSQHPFSSSCFLSAASPPPRSSLCPPSHCSFSLLLSRRLVTRGVAGHRRDDEVGGQGGHFHELSSSCERRGADG
eukprot:767676-Hanusia_phi.AAC.1